MTQRFTLQDCIDLATFAHRHQYDKAGEPYINHPKRVLQSVQAQGAPAYVQMAAVLHDVTEDTPFTPEMLMTLGVPEAAVNIVQVLDRGLSKEIYYAVGSGQQGAEETWPEYAQFIAHHSADEFYYWNMKRIQGAVLVKKADIGDNTQPWRLEYLPLETQDRLRKKYAKALDLLA